MGQQVDESLFTLKVSKQENGDAFVIDNLLGVEFSLKPEKVLQTTINGRDFVWESYAPNQTGLRVVGVTDMETGAWVGTTNANNTLRTEAYRAWSGARQSRAPGTPVEIMSQITEAGVDPDTKLNQMFTSYGHASVADMAMLDVHFDNVPGHMPLAFFNHSQLNGGQEKSTRYQSEFSDRAVHPLGYYLDEAVLKIGAGRKLEEAYNALGTLALQNFQELQPRVTKAYTDFYKPDTEGPKAVAHAGALGSRVLDTVRFFLPIGGNTGFMSITNARDWSRQIGHLKSMHPLYADLGNQIQLLLSPPDIDISTADFRIDDRANAIEDMLGYKAGAPTLIKYADEYGVIRDNIATLDKFLEKKTTFSDEVKPVSTPGYNPHTIALIDDAYDVAERMVAQYVTATRPGLDVHDVLNWVSQQEDSVKKKMSSIIFNGHDKYNELSQLAETTGLGLSVEGSLGELRDFNRQRAWARHIPGLPMLHGLAMTADVMRDTLDMGYGLAEYLTEVPEFKGVRKDFEKRLNAYYKQFGKLIDQAENLLGSDADLTFAVNLVPMAQRMDLWMHGNPKQASYMTELRVKPGGHINYRTLAWEMNEAIADSNPLLEGLRISEDRKPLAGDREQFFDRS